METSDIIFNLGKIVGFVLIFLFFRFLYKKWKNRKNKA